MVKNGCAWKKRFEIDWKENVWIGEMQKDKMKRKFENNRNWSPD